MENETFKIETRGVFGFQHAFKIMRLPMGNAGESDSGWCDGQEFSPLCDGCPYSRWDPDSYEMYCLNEDQESVFVVGPEDMILSEKLLKEGADKAKHLDHIFVQCVITAPKYLLSDLASYKDVPSRPVYGSVEPYDHSAIVVHSLVGAHAPTTSFSYFRRQTVGFTFSYANLAKIYRQHSKPTPLTWLTLVDANQQPTQYPLPGWGKICRWIESLPYSELITGAGS